MYLVCVIYDRWKKEVINSLIASFPSVFICVFNLDNTFVFASWHCFICVDTLSYITQSICAIDEMTLSILSTLLYLSWVQEKKKQYSIQTCAYQINFVYNKEHMAFPGWALSLWDAYIKWVHIQWWFNCLYQF